jgi:prepilin-type N-terminal cleavage/methylation domain-containing protein
MKTGERQFHLVEQAFQPAGSPDFPVRQSDGRLESRPNRQTGMSALRRQSGFTMVEIAISLAVIGIALVAIIGVLPIGMNTQRDNREETIINQDATVLMEAIRGGARGLDDLTNYVYAITNFQVVYPAGTPKTYGYTYVNSTLNGSPITPLLTNGFLIIGLLSTPEYLDVNGFPTNNLFMGGYSNHVVAYVRSISGPAVEKPPQPNDSIIREDSFGYRILCVNAPVAVDTNIFNLPPAQQLYTKQLAANLHELRLTFLWPQLPNGKVGPGRQTFRTMVAGQILKTSGPGNMPVYFYQSQSFVNTP